VQKSAEGIVGMGVPARSIGTLTQKGRNSQGSQGRSDMLKAQTMGSGK